MPGKCYATDDPCVEGGPCHEAPQNDCVGHECDDYVGYNEDPPEDYPEDLEGEEWTPPAT